MEVTRGRFLGTLEPHRGCEQYRVEEIVPPETRKKGMGSIEDVDMANIPDRYQREYKSLLRLFQDVFSLNPDDIGKVSVIRHKIELKDPTKISSVPPYRIPHNLQPVAAKYVQKLLDAGVVQKSTSPFSSPLDVGAKGKC